MYQNENSGGSSRELKRLLELERKDGVEQLRLSVDEFTPNQGRPARYLSLRVWFKNHDGEWCPTKKGLTIKRHEVAQISDVLNRIRDQWAQNYGAQQPPKPAPKSDPWGMTPENADDDFGF